MKKIIIIMTTFHVIALATFSDSENETPEIYQGPLWVEESWSEEEIEPAAKPRRMDDEEESNIEDDEEEANSEDDEEDQGYHVTGKILSINIKHTRGEFCFDEQNFSKIFKNIFDWEDDELNNTISSSPNSLMEKEETYGFTLLSFAIVIGNKAAVNILLQYKIIITADDISLALCHNTDIGEILIKSTTTKDRKFALFNDKNWQGTTLAHQIVIDPSEKTMTNFLNLSLVDGKTVINPLIETPTKCNLFMYMHERSCFTRFEEVFNFFIEHYGDRLPEELFFSNYHGSILQAVISRIGSCPGEFPFCPSLENIQCIINYCPLLINHTCDKYSLTPLDMLHQKHSFSRDWPIDIGGYILRLIDLIKEHGGLSTQEFLSTPLPPSCYTKSAMNV